MVFFGKTGSKQQDYNRKALEGAKRQCPELTAPDIAMLSLPRAPICHCRQWVVPRAFYGRFYGGTAPLHEHAFLFCQRSLSLFDEFLLAMAATTFASDSWLTKLFLRLGGGGSRK